jgi:hypothetical protein
MVHARSRLTDSNLSEANVQSICKSLFCNTFEQIQEHTFDDAYGLLEALSEHRFNKNPGFLANLDKYHQRGVVSDKN